MKEGNKSAGTGVFRTEAGGNMKRIRARTAKSDINITPLIDVLLVLLVIFMVITPMTPKGLRTIVPEQAAPGQKAASEKVIVLSMDRNGVLRINQEEVELGNLFARLEDILKTRGDRTVFVQGDSDLLFNDIAQMIDIARGAGATRIGFMY
jgi:biopolymer transport protein ExbD